jgi:RNA polymerase sigma-70 factor (ECF subfamily)
MNDRRAASYGAGPDPEFVRDIGTDRAALEKFYLAYYPDVLRYCARRCQDPHDVADLVADTFFSAMTSAGRYRPDRGQPLAWLLGIAHNTLRRQYRQRSAETRAAKRLAGRRLLDAEDIAQIEEQIDAEQRVRGAYGALDSLSATDRELVELIDVNGLTTKEAATALGLLPGTARVRLFRARARLRTALQLREDSQ